MLLIGWSVHVFAITQVVYSLGDLSQYVDHEPREATWLSIATSNGTLPRDAF